MKYFQDKVGHAAELFADYPIDNATVINEGTPVKISNGKVVAAVAAGTDSLLGVAAESHAGAEYALELKDRRKKSACTTARTQSSKQGFILSRRPTAPAVFRQRCRRQTRQRAAFLFAPKRFPVAVA